MQDFDFNLSKSDLDKLIKTIHYSDPVSGFTHDFYKYPARFSPVFARNIIKLFQE